MGTVTPAEGDRRAKRHRGSLIGRCFLLALLLPVAGVVTGQSDPPASEKVSRLVAEAGRALEEENLEAAEGGFRNALELNPDLALAWLGLSQVHESRGEHLEALKVARRAQKLQPEEATAVLAVGRLLARLGAVPEALATLAEARTLDPQESRAYLLAAILLRDLGRTQEAIELLESGRERGIEEPALSEQLGLLLLSEGEVERARRLAEVALQRHPDRGGLELVMGLALAADPEVRAQAVPRLERALELGAPEPGKIHLELAALLGAEHSEAALEHLREAVRLLPESAQAYYRLGTALRAAGDMEGARAALLRFQELSRRHDAEDWGGKEVGTALNEAQNLAQENRMGEALEHLDGLLEEHPEEAKVLVLRAKVLFSMGRREEALASMVRARELVPGRVEYHYLEGMFLVRLERLAEAEPVLLRALALDPDLAPAHALLGLVALGREDAAEAVDRFRQALDLGADSPNLRLNYATALRSLGRLEEGEQQMQAYRRLLGE
jgi:tetratricopeptide (TPR) repeat protein